MSRNVLATAATFKEYEKDGAPDVCTSAAGSYGSARSITAPPLEYFPHQFDRGGVPARYVHKGQDRIISLNPDAYLVEGAPGSEVLRLRYGERSVPLDHHHQEVYCELLCLNRMIASQRAFNLLPASEIRTQSCDLKRSLVMSTCISDILEAIFGEQDDDNSPPTYFGQPLFLAIQPTHFALSKENSDIIDDATLAAVSAWIEQVESYLS